MSEVCFVFGSLLLFEPAGSAVAMGLAERHRQHIGRWFYECSYEIHTGLADMYVADERFRSVYERIRPGLAQYLHDARSAVKVFETSGTRPEA